MKFFKYLLLLVLPLMFSSAALAEEPDLARIVKSYVSALEVTNQETVSTEDRDTLYNFYTDDISFTHVKFDMTIEPKDELRARSEQFAGWNRNVTLTITNLIVGQDMAVIELSRTGEQKDMDSNWNPSNNTSVMVLEFEGDKIKRVLNY